jgi:hypothetical protein
MRQLPLGAEAANVIDAGRGCAMDLGDGRAVEGRGLAWRGVDPTVVVGHQ